MGRTARIGAGLGALMLAGGAQAQLSSGLMGGLLPNVGTTSAGNAAGLLSYCVKNQLLGTQDAAGIVGKLTGDKAVTSSKDFAQGSAGILQTGGNSQLSLADLKGKVKTKLCDMVLQHGKSLAGLR